MREIPEAIQEELQRVKRLRRNAFGPIPETYDTLHGIVFLKEIYRRIRDGRGLDEALRDLPFCCLALTMLNASALLRDAADALDASPEPDIAGAAAKLHWCGAILGIATEITHVADVLADGASGRPASGPVPCLDVMRAAFGAAGEAIVTLDARHDGLLDDAVRSGYLDDPAAGMVHSYKNIAWQITMLEAARISADVPDAEDIIALSALGMEALALERDTYNDQFTLLHQVPELIAFVSIELINAAIADLAKKELSGAERSIRVVNALFPCVNLCLQPLVTLMYPSEYYKFRENLGATSGSHSKDFGSMLLSRKYEELSRAFRDATADPQGDEEALRWQVLTLRQNLYRWRDVHMMLPRNVLGSGATSLAGTKEATSSVEKMRRNFMRRDMLGEKARATHAGADGGDRAAAGREAEQRLLQITGDIARGTFPEVEQRSGPVFGKQKAE